LGQPSPTSLLPNTSRPSPTTSPFKSNTPTTGETGENNPQNAANNNAALLSRLRSGSLGLPQRINYVGSGSPFGSGYLSNNWSNNRDRATTLTSIASAGSDNNPSSPSQSSRVNDGVDNEMRTLDYLGLADTPQPVRATLARPMSMETVMEGQRAHAMQPFLAELAGQNKNLSRFRSYSVNAGTEKYADEDDETENPLLYSGNVTPGGTHTDAMRITQQQIHQHNLAVQAFANNANIANRPRARTAGVLDSPMKMKSYLATPSGLNNGMSAADLRPSYDFDGLPEAIKALQLNGLGTRGQNENGGMIDENNLEGPTRALWLGSIPASTTSTSLLAIFGQYGDIESARVLTHKNCGFVNFAQVQSAVQARSFFNGKEIFPGAGPVRIGFAKAPTTSATGTPGPNGTHQSPTPEPFTNGKDAGAIPNGSAGNGALAGNAATGEPKLPAIKDMKDDMIRIVAEFGANEEDQLRIGKSIDESIAFDRFQPEVPAIPEPSHNRVHDAPKLREIRKRIDNNTCSRSEIEEIALGMLDEIAELSSDYLGNTVVQKLFEYCDDQVKEDMLRMISPTIAEIGIHKNGTWAAQKIIDVAKTPTQMNMIVENLRAYTVALFLDQYGNYVLQCCLRFGSPWNDFIFETMLSRMWEISQGRFGARAMRACLESHHATKDQQRMLAAAIALHSVQLATNQNGALLLTWFLDTCTFPHRRTVLAPRLVPHLVHLCTHKVAYLTVLKVINQRNEPDARDTIFKALFFSPNDKVLEDILHDQSCGATLIFKVLTTPFFDENLRTEVVQNVRNVLVRLKAQPSQGYKRLMDEVGVSTRTGIGGGVKNESGRGDSPHGSQRRSSSQNNSQSSHQQQQQHQPMERQFSGQQQYYANPGIPPQYEQNFAQAMPRSIDPSGIAGLDQFGGINGLNSPMFGGNGQSPISPISPQQLQYQALLAAQQRTSSGTFYGGMGGMNGYQPSPSVDSFRQAQASPMLPNSQMSPSPMLGGQFAPPGFNPLMGMQSMQGMGGMMGGYGYPPMGNMQYVGQPQHPQGRRSRVGHPSNPQYQNQY
jgi:protein JSN1